MIAALLALAVGARVSTECNEGSVVPFRSCSSAETTNRFHKQPVQSARFVQTRELRGRSMVQASLSAFNSAPSADLYLYMTQSNWQRQNALVHLLSW